MTTLDTPLHEVAHFLSPATAELLMNQDAMLQDIALRAVRRFLAILESGVVGNGPIVMDPVQTEEKLDAIVRRIVNGLT